MSYSVSIIPSQHSFHAEGNETLLDAALNHGLSLPYGCRNGSCGACKGRLVSGEIDYGDANISALLDWDKAAGMALFCQARPRSDVVIEVQEVRSLTQVPIRTLPCRVRQKKLLCHDVMGLWLELPRTERLQFLAGQYIDILLPDGRKRSYSLANPPHQDDALEIHIRRYPNGVFSEQVFSGMREGALLRIRGPHGNFTLNEDSDRPMIFVAGGTGFAPVKGIIEHTLAEELTRPIHLYCGVRARRDLYMDELARGWAGQHSHIRYIPVLSEPEAGDPWDGRTGLVHQAVLEDFEDLAGYEVYTSGPPVMVKAVKTEFPQQGLDADRIYADAFERAK
jgi:CDP-4-dehydro-6-deoxyglucose reductase